MLRRLSQFKSYKDLFNNIEEEFDQSYFMEDDFASKEDTPTQQQKLTKSTPGKKQLQTTP